MQNFPSHIKQCNVERHRNMKENGKNMTEQIKKKEPDL
jgi:hypothetical protein